MKDLSMDWYVVNENKLGIKDFLFEDEILKQVQDDIPDSSFPSIIMPFLY